MSKFDAERNSDGAATEARAAWLSELAQAEPDRLEALWRATGLAPDYHVLRAPEIGLVMTRGRAGAVGEAFNLGEASVARCSIRLSSGEEGHAYALGRDRRKVETAALCDALMQTAFAGRISTEILSPLALEREERDRAEARRTQATRVEFFTMTRGED